MSFHCTGSRPSSVDLAVQCFALLRDPVRLGPLVGEEPELHLALAVPLLRLQRSAGPALLVDLVTTMAFATSRIFLPDRKFSDSETGS